MYQKHELPFGPVLAQKSAAVLVLAHQLPTELENFAGELVFFGVSAGPSASNHPAHSLFLEPSVDRLNKLFKNYCSSETKNFDYIYIDANHSIIDISWQVNAALHCAHPRTCFIFPGGAPKTVDEIGPEPKQSWWTGEVWTLPYLLRPTGPLFDAGAIEVGPLGFILARSFAEMEAEDACARSKELHRMLESDNDLQKMLVILSDARASRLLGERDIKVPSDQVRVIVDWKSPDCVTTQILSEEKPWSRPRPHFLLDLSNGQADLSRLHEESRVAQGVQLDAFRSVYALGHDIFVSGALNTAQMRFYLKNSRPDVSDRTLKSFKEPDASGHVWEAPVRATEDYFYCDRDVLAGAEKIDAPCFLGSPDEDLNWGMWLLFNIPSAHQYRSLAEKYPKFLCFAELGWQRAFLEALGIGPDKLVPQKRGQVYYASSAISLRTTFRGMVLRPTDIEAFDSYADLFASQLTPEATPQRIYISRSNQKTRQLINEAELEGQLEKLGFIVVRPETMSIRHQARLFRNADVVVGVGGAAMFNAAFCRTGAKLVDIESGTGFVDSHANIFASRGLDYGIIIGEQDQTDPVFYHKRWSIDTARAMEAIVSFVEA